MQKQSQCKKQPNHIGPSIRRWTEISACCLRRSSSIMPNVLATMVADVPGEEAGNCVVVMRASFVFVCPGIDRQLATQKSTRLLQPPWTLTKHYLIISSSSSIQFKPATFSTPWSESDFFSFSHSLLPSCFNLQRNGMRCIFTPAYACVTILWFLCLMLCSQSTYGLQQQINKEMTKGYSCYLSKETISLMNQRND